MREIFIFSLPYLASPFLLVPLFQRACQVLCVLFLIGGWVFQHPFNTAIAVL